MFIYFTHACARVRRASVARCVQNDAGSFGFAYEHHTQHINKRDQVGFYFETKRQQSALLAPISCPSVLSACLACSNKFARVWFGVKS